MTAQKTLKRQIRSRMNKTGESYTAARRHFRIAKDLPMSSQEFEFPRTPIAQELQSNLWPEWVTEHLWLKAFLPRAEAEARNQGDRECDHFHMILAFLRLPSPVTDWFGQLRVNTVQWREDTLVAIGSNHDTTTIGKFAEFGRRIMKARRSQNPVDEVPLEKVTLEALRMLELARSEAERDNVPIDERHFMVPMLDWHPYGEPTLDELRQITGRE